MSLEEDKIENLIRGVSEAYVSRDVEKMLSFFAEDVDHVSPWGTLKGKEELRRYLIWETQGAPNVKVRDHGVGILVKGNKAVYEHIVEAVTPDGRKFDSLTIYVCEFRDEKIQHIRVLNDRLSIAKQVARGWLVKKIINAVVSRMEKGLH